MCDFSIFIQVLKMHLSIGGEPKLVKHGLVHVPLESVVLVDRVVFIGRKAAFNFAKINLKKVYLL